MLYFIYCDIKEILCFLLKLIILVAILLSPYIVEYIFDSYFPV